LESFEEQASNLIFSFAERGCLFRMNLFPFPYICTSMDFSKGFHFCLLHDRAGSYRGRVAFFPFATYTFAWTN